MLALPGETRLTFRALCAVVLAVSLSAPAVGSPDIQNPTSGVLARASVSASAASRERQLTAAKDTRVQAGDGPGSCAPGILDVVPLAVAGAGRWLPRRAPSSSRHAWNTPLLLAPKTSPPPPR